MRIVDYYILLHYISPLIFFFLSKFDFSRIKTRTITKNYFSYFIVFECLILVVFREVIRDERNPFWEVSTILNVAIPLLMLIKFLTQKASFIWFYLAYAIGTSIYYFVNIFEPGMSLALNMNVVLENLIMVSAYFYYLRKNFRNELVISYNSFKFWLNDFDRKEAMAALMPFIIGAFFCLIILLVVVFKFRHILLQKLGFH